MATLKNMAHSSYLITSLQSKPLKIDLTHRSHPFLGMGKKTPFNQATSWAQQMKWPPNEVAIKLTYAYYIINVTDGFGQDLWHA